MQPVVTVTAEELEELSIKPTKLQSAFQPISSLLNPRVHQLPHVGRNQPCPCKSGKKFKQCCLSRAKETTRTVTCARCKQAFYRRECDAGIPEHHTGFGGLTQHTCPGSGEIVK